MFSPILVTIQSSIIPPTAVVNIESEAEEIEINRERERGGGEKVCMCVNKFAVLQ